MAIIRAAAGCPALQTEADGKAVDQAAEDTNQQHIIRNRHGREQVRQYTGQNDGQCGINSELLADFKETDGGGNGIEHKIDNRKWECNV